MKSSLIDKVDKATASRRYDEALEECSMLLARFSDDADDWYKHGVLLQLLRRHQEALVSFSRAIELADFEPSYWFARGRQHLESGSFLEAARDFGCAVDAEKGEAKLYYGETARFYQAYSLVLANRPCEAREALSVVSSEFSTWARGRIVSREDVLSMLQSSQDSGAAPSPAESPDRD